ncbi:tyrosine kinase receptor Cad96Ca-like isoform X1 [Montipora foliosa]|uniref:tyrosine kinase receptor Cad96Ca-like isoform X1 n=1 Tax=Montipora foliosa TaxID=591990 RepID=UPI0035F1E873
MKAYQDFGNYTCEARNVVGAAAPRLVQLNQIKAPGSLSLTTNDNDIRASSLAIKWTAPVDDGGSAITGYKLIILHDDNVILNETTSAGLRQYLVGGLNRSTTYTLRVSAMNRVFEGAASKKKATTKYEGAPATVEIVGLPPETKNVSVIIKWKEPESNGAPITQYTVYQRIVNKNNTVGEWNKIGVIKDLSRRQVIVDLKRNKVYEFAVTATNKYGDSLHEGKKLVVLGVNAPPSDRKDLLSELELMKKMKPHPHVIKLIGCVTESEPLMVLIEYVPFGDLLGYLRKSRGLNDTYYKDPDVQPETNLTSEQLIKFAWQVADGMCYLCSKKIVHRDLAARNVLVGEGERCKVTDFGMARNVGQDDIYTKKSRGRLPVKWTAFEALLYGVYTTQSDVWSYGILLYEILTIGGSPYPDTNARLIADKIQKGYRMPKPRHVDSKLYEIMMKCWEEDPSDRPTFEKLRRTMKDMERNHKTYVNLSQYDTRMYANVTDLTAE